MPIRLGIIGTGIAARDLHRPALKRLGDRIEIVALANRRPEKAEAFAQMTGGQPRVTSDYHELLSWPEVEAVDLALPIVMNAPVAIEALRAGKHVIVEKPIAASVVAGRNLVDEATRHPDLVLLVAENVRYDPRFHMAQRFLEAGQIGRVLMIHDDVLTPLAPDSPYATTSWRMHPEHVGGSLSDGGVHHAAALHMLAGPVSLVEALVVSFHPEREPTDTLLVNIQFTSGAIGHLTFSVGVHQPEPSPLRVYGTDGSLAVHEDRIIISTLEGEQEISVPPLPNGHDLEFADFYQAVVGGKQPDVSPRDALADLELIDAALRSAREGRVIRLD